MLVKKTKLLFKASVISLCFILLALGASCNFVDEEPPSGLPPEFDIVTEAWDIISKDYIDRDELDAQKLSQAAVEGMLEALDDPYSSYLSPEVYELELSSFKGKYQGIGAYVGIKDEQLIIIAPIVGSPAEKAGIEAGDIILEIDGASASEMTLVEAALKIQGPASTSVRLLVLSEGENEPAEVEIVRDNIKLESVYWEVRDNIAYIRIMRFAATTGDEFSAALKDVTDRNVEGIILDLRSNPGGLLNVVVDVASNLLDGGTVVDVVYDEGNHSPLLVDPRRTSTNLPLIVLVDSWSASGSEVLAGALQDHGRAKLAGSTTFGKGSVNTIQPLKDGSAMSLTIARWHTPLGRPIEGLGLDPDFPLELEGEDMVDWAADYLKNSIEAGD